MGLKLTKKLYVKINEKRENLEDFISKDVVGNINKLLEIADESKQLDELEKKGIQAGIKAANAYFSQYGTLPDNVTEQISEYTVKAIGKANKKLQSANKKLQTQLEKKSKIYKENH